jgi:hemerythrin
MTTISWINDYAINIEKIDNQHKELMDKINLLYDAFINSKEYEEIVEILEKLSVYAGKHYRTEEIYMISYGYANIDIHRIEHRNFIRQVELFKNRFKNGVATLTVEFIMFLKQWLVKHMEGSDKTLGRFLKDFGIE